MKLVPTSQRAEYGSFINRVRLMLLSEVFTVHLKNHIEHMNALCGRNVKVLNVKAHGRPKHTYYNHCVSKA
jgi:hypothetical protein